MNKIFYIMGKSSSGKDTIFKELKKRHPDLKTVVLYTTRPIRSGEKDGEDYFFVDEEVLKEMEEKNKIIEMRTYYTECGVWKYFTADDGQIDLNHNSYLVIGTLESFKDMCEYFGKECLVPIYIEVNDGLRLERALKREQSQDEPKYAEMCRRFLADEKDFSEEKLKEAGIGRRFLNTDFETCMDEIEKYLEAVC